MGELFDDVQIDTTKNNVTVFVCSGIKDLAVRDCAGIMLEELKI